MKTKNLIILGSILLIVLGIIFVSEKLNSSPSSGKTKKFFPTFSKSNCSSLEIADKSGTVKLVKKGDKWLVTSAQKAKDEAGTSNPLSSDGAASQPSSVSSLTSSEEYPADSSSIESALEKITTMKMVDLISQNAKKREVFEVDSAKGTLLEVFDSQNKSLGKVIIGKSGPDWSSHYVRAVGSDDVFTVSGSIKYSFFTDENRWRDKTIIKFDQTFAKTITLVKKDQAPITVEKTIDTAGVPVWHITAPEKSEAKKEIVEKMVKALSDLKTTEWEKDKSLSNETMGFDNPDLVAKVVLENGDQKIVYVGKKKDDGSKKWVKTDGKNTVFLVYDSRFNDIDKSLNDFKGIEEKPEDKKEAKAKKGKKTKKKRKKKSS